MLQRYAEERAKPVENDSAAIEALGVKPITGNFVQEQHFARHATDRLCQKLLRLAEFDRSALREKAYSGA
jgi:hypothetical protein